MTNWTEAEIQILRKHYGKKTHREIANLLENRHSKHGVRCKAYDLDISHKKPSYIVDGECPGLWFSQAALMVEKE